MAADDPATAELLAGLWDLLEEWSSDAIQRTRGERGAGPSEVAEAEIRMLVAHAAELRGVIENYLDGALREPDHAPQSAATGSLPEPESGPQGQPDPQAAPQPAVRAADHACNSADFERPACEACGCQHWFCSICGLQQDVCTALPIAVTPSA
ncbi:hypothetical protein [Nocardioides sp.]|uniref:hypothetical protein n=1 Tax=Nocardioides sp. TaxID=35761 RepID=UPI002CB5EDFC|nr:hypothetical protein [Nocardioides sp.]HSX67020.1 hypothetical protein [Nocardioides sp.]